MNDRNSLTWNRRALERFFFFDEQHVKFVKWKQKTFLFSPRLWMLKEEFSWKTVNGHHLRCAKMTQNSAGDGGISDIQIATRGTGTSQEMAARRTKPPSVRWLTMTAASSDHLRTLQGRERDAFLLLLFALASLLSAACPPVEKGEASVTWEPTVAKTSSGVLVPHVLGDGHVCDLSLCLSCNCGIYLFYLNQIPWPMQLKSF